MPKALIIGGNGMLGHKALRVFSTSFEVAGTVREDATAHRADRPLAAFRLFGNVTAEAVSSIEAAILSFAPDVVLNCIAMRAATITMTNMRAAQKINGELPHEIARICARSGCKFFQISTDAVFSGNAGGYRESDKPDPVDFYGETKLSGEVDAPGALTVRTSIFGRQLIGKDGLIEWLMSEKGNSIDGFRKVLFSGLPTVTLCELVRDIAAAHADLHGVLHIGAPAISKYALLQKLNQAMGLGISVRPVDTPVVDRSLNCDLFKRVTGRKIPDWPELINAFVADENSYL